jgi:hypothetical protein
MICKSDICTLDLFGAITSCALQMIWRVTETTPFSSLAWVRPWATVGYGPAEVLPQTLLETQPLRALGHLKSCVPVFCIDFYSLCIPAFRWCCQAIRPTTWLSKSGHLRGIKLTVQKLDFDFNIFQDAVSDLPNNWFVSSTCPTF